MIVNKQTGQCHHLGSAFPLERDLRAYDDGFQCSHYDLKIIRIQDRERTLELLQELDISVVEVEWEHGRRWRIPRRLSRGELNELLLTLPHTFRDLPIYFRIEAIQEARRHGYCEFELSESKSEGAA